jgi:hypothetical protein
MLIFLTIAGIALFVICIFVESGAQDKRHYKPIQLTKEERAAGFLLKDIVLGGKILVCRSDVSLYPKGLFCVQVYGNSGGSLAALLTIVEMDQEQAMRTWYSVLVYTIQFKKLPLEWQRT